MSSQFRCLDGAAGAGWIGGWSGGPCAGSGPVLTSCPPSPHEIAARVRVALPCCVRRLQYTRQRATRIGDEQRRQTCGDSMSSGRGTWGAARLPLRHDALVHGAAEARQQVLQGEDPVATVQIDGRWRRCAGREVHPRGGTRRSSMAVLADLSMRVSPARWYHSGAGSTSVSSGTPGSLAPMRPPVPARHGPTTRHGSRH